MKKMVFPLLALALSATGSKLTAQVVKGPSSSKTPYVVPTVPGGKVISLLTAGDIINGYPMAGLPDGAGAYDNGNGTFTVLVNHEMGNTSGAVHAHGSTGAFVSRWVINKADHSVISGSDLMQNVNLWSSVTSAYTNFSAANPSLAARFTRFCSADLPAVSAFYNAATGMGTQERIFMNGEESGAEGRGMAHIATGPNAGTSWELPRLGKYSYENAVAAPGTGDKTVVIGLDDATPGQVYVYIGTKTNAGTEVEKAGLTNGTLYGVAVSGMMLETNGFVPTPNTSFILASLGNVQNLTGSALETSSNNAGITRFLRPEDGAWDPQHPEDFYFVTTNSFSSPTRLWRLHFSNINDFTLGGTITAVLDGTEGQKMLDNIGFDQWGHILMQEDVGGNIHLGKTWEYNTMTDALTLVGTHDSTRFLPGASQFLTIDEEASGIIDLQDILGAGWFFGVDMAHHSMPHPIVSGGQLYLFFNPGTYNAACALFTPSITVSPSTPVPGQLANTIYTGYGPQSVDLTASAPTTYPPVNFTWMPGGSNAGTITVTPTASTTYSLIASNGLGCVDTIAQTITVKDIRDGNKNKVWICKNGNTMTVSVNAVPSQLANGAMLGACELNARLTTTVSSDRFVVHPNPADNSATVSLSLTETEHVTVGVYDLQGRSLINVASNTYEAGTYQLNISTAHLPAGIYTIRIAAGKDESQLKMVVAH